MRIITETGYVGILEGSYYGFRGILYPFLGSIVDARCHMEVQK